MKKIFLILSLVAMGLSSCTIEEHFRTDTMTSAQLKQDPSAAVYTTDGVYSLFKDELQYKNIYASGNTYVRHFFQMAEYRADNVVLSGITSDPFSYAFTYDDNATMNNNQGFWWLAYKIIYSANSNIEALDENASDEAAHMKGENYFFRALAHFNLVNIFARPLSRGESNPGVILRTSTDCSVTERATVGEVYAQVVADLEEAARLMKGKAPRGDKGYVSYEAAMGLLSRVYLYMEEYDKVIETVNTMLTGSAGDYGNIASKLDSNYSTLFTNARTSNEVLWCVAHTATEDKGTGSLGSMYYSPNGTGGIGWCEHYYSDTLLELFERYPEDKRQIAQYELYDTTNDGLVMVHWPLDEGGAFRNNAVVRGVTKNADGTCNFTYSGKSYVATPEVINGYTEYFITYEGAKTKVYVRPNVGLKGLRNNYPIYMQKKYSNQDGLSNLSSPIIVRWGEVVLNRAEARLKAGDEAGALADVNVIRSRAGIPVWNDTDHRWQDHGYANLLEVVLAERRLELCFEGHRAFDTWRNKMSMDRRFAGLHTWEVVEYTDDRIPFQIPQDELNVNDIGQNPR